VADVIDMSDPMNISAEPIRLAAARMNAAATPQAARSPVTNIKEVHVPDICLEDSATPPTAGREQTYSKKPPGL